MFVLQMCPLCNPRRLLCNLFGQLKRARSTRAGTAWTTHLIFQTKGGGGTAAATQWHSDAPSVSLTSPCSSVITTFYIITAAESEPSNTFSIFLLHSGEFNRSAAEGEHEPSCRAPRAIYQMSPSVYSSSCSHTHTPSQHAGSLHAATLPGWLIGKLRQAGRQILGNIFRRASQMFLPGQEAPADTRHSLSNRAVTP